MARHENGLGRAIGRFGRRRLAREWLGLFILIGIPVLLCTAQVNAERIAPLEYYATVELNDGSLLQGFSLPYNAKSTLPDTRDKAPTLALALPHSPANYRGCEPISITGVSVSSQILKDNADGLALVLQRGACSYEEKIRHAQEAEIRPMTGKRGRTLTIKTVVIIDTIEAMYNLTDPSHPHGTGYLIDACSVDCSIGGCDPSAPRNDTTSVALDKDICSSGICARNGPTGARATQQCCVLNETPLAYAFNSPVAKNKTKRKKEEGTKEDAEGPTIAVVTLNIIQGETLDKVVEGSLSESPLIRAYRRPLPFDYSLPLLISLGVLVTISAAYFAATRERIFALYGSDALAQAASRMRENGDGEEGEEDVATGAEMPQVGITPGLALCFIGSATAMLVLLYFLLQLNPSLIVIGICFMYALGSVGGMAIEVFEPLARYLFPTWASRSCRPAARWADRTLDRLSETIYGHDDDDDEDEDGDINREDQSIKLTRAGEGMRRTGRGEHQPQRHRRTTMQREFYFTREEEANREVAGWKIIPLGLGSVVAKLCGGFESNGEAVGTMAGALVAGWWFVARHEWYVVLVYYFFFFFFFFFLRHLALFLSLSLSLSPPFSLFLVETMKWIHVVVSSHYS